MDDFLKLNGGGAVDPYADDFGNDRKLTDKLAVTTMGLDLEQAMLIKMRFGGELQKLDVDGS